ncbi:hypothetical protein JCM31598_28890 [Desulfonatronum parangueonense]
MLQPELFPKYVTPLPHWGPALPGFSPLITTCFEQLQFTVQFCPGGLSHRIGWDQALAAARQS